VAVVVTLACGLVPIARLFRAHAGEQAVRGGRTQIAGGSRAQWTLAATQVALAVVLLAGAGLLIRSLQNLTQVSAGFDPSHILTFHISGSYAETADFPRLTQRVDRTLDALRAIPGVASAASASALPGVPGGFPADITLLDGGAPSDAKVTADIRFVSATYFSTVQIPILEGEVCRQTSPVAPRSAVVNRSFAQAYFPGSSAVGRQLRIASTSNDPSTVQGVVADVREQGLDRAPRPTVYWCFSASGPTPFFLIRTATRPAAMAETVRRSIKAIDPARAVFAIAPLDERIAGAYGEQRVRTILLTSFASLAVVLAGVGLYGTLSYLVGSRRREVGLRLALGATRMQIIAHFFGQGFGVSALGCAAGLVLSLAAGRWLSSVLFEISPSDPATLLGVTAIILTIAAFALIVPSTRGARVEPMEVLREE
jgi:putative ABC transport system permease protein